MRRAFHQRTRACRLAVVAGLAAALATSAASAQSSKATPAGGSGQALAGQTIPVRSPAASKAAAAAVPQTTGTRVPAGLAAARPVPGMMAMPADTGTVDSATAAGLGPDVIWVPEKAGPQLRRQVTGGQKSQKTTYIRSSSGKPTSSLTIDKERPIAPIDDRARPRVWCAPATEHISPINGNLLRDSHLRYEDGDVMLGHHFGNDIWTASDRTVRVSCDANWAASFQLITELQGKQRRIQILADDLDGPRILPAGHCIKISRLWYVRGKKGREVDGWWDEPPTLIPLLKPVNVPPPDNGVIGQTNQSFFVNIHIPRMVFAGTYRTTLHVKDLDDPLYEEDIRVEVTASPWRTRR